METHACTPSGAVICVCKHMETHACTPSGAVIYVYIHMQTHACMHRCVCTYVHTEMGARVHEEAAQRGKRTVSLRTRYQALK